MSIINSVGFRIPFRRVWPYRHSLFFKSGLYSSTLVGNFLAIAFIKKYFSRRYFKRYEFMLSHYLVKRFPSNRLHYTVFVSSRFFRGVMLYCSIYLMNLYQSVRHRRSSRFLRKTIFRAFKLSQSYSMRLFLLYRDSLLRSLKAFSAMRLNVSMDFKLIFFKAPPAAYLASLFAYKLGTGLDLNRIVRPFLRSFRRRYPLLKGVRLVCSGRFSRKQRAQHSILFEGVVPTNTLRSKLDYAVMTSRLKYGACSIKIWLNFK